MKYRVHHLKVNEHNIQSNLENFLNGLDGYVVAILPNVVPKFHLMGATGTVDSVLIVERTDYD